MEADLSLPASRPTRCHACDQLFASENDRRNHINDGSCPGPAPKYDCPHCHKSFFKKVVLKNHIMTHTGERPYNCTVCGQKFRRSHHRKRHMEGVHNVSPKSTKRAKVATSKSPELERYSTGKVGQKSAKKKKTENDYNHRKTITASSQYSDVEDCAVSSKSSSLQNGTNSHTNAKNLSLHEKQHYCNNNNALPGVASKPLVGNLNDNLGGYITVPPQFSSGKQTSTLNIPLQNVTQMFTFQGQLGDIFPLMSAMINSNDVQTLSVPNLTAPTLGQVADPNSLIETSISFPEITSAWSNMMEEDQNPHKCFLCSLKFSSQCDLESHLREHVKMEEIPNGES